jgi:DNA-binding NtrC family response regulator
MNKQPNILLVDDKQEWLSFSQLSLSREGYSVELSKDVQHALELCQNKRFSLVLVDFNCMEREEKWFKNLISHANSRYVVVLSSMDLSPEKLRKAFNFGAFDCVEKCYDAQNLLLLVEKQLNDIRQKSKAKE